MGFATLPKAIYAPPPLPFPTYHLHSSVRPGAAISHYPCGTQDTAASVDGIQTAAMASSTVVDNKETLRIQGLRASVVSSTARAIPEAELVRDRKAAKGQTIIDALEQGAGGPV